MTGRFFLLFLSLFLVAGNALAADPEKLVHIRLVPEYGAIPAAGTLTIAIEQKIAPGWHTYWKNPGDSGSAPRITWALPEGFTAGDIEWPAPHRLPYGPLMNFGYDGHAVLLQTITAPEFLPAGPITLSADIEVLVCKEECIPEYGTYTLMLNGPESQQEENASFVAAAREKIPLPVNWEVSYAEDEGHLAVTIPGENIRGAGIDTALIDLSSVTFIPAEWGVLENVASQTATFDGDLVISQMRGQRALSAITQLPGVLRFTAAGQDKIFAISAAAKNAPAAAKNPAEPLQQEEQQGFSGWLQAMLLAMAGGVILNLMPCVFPVLSLKALSLVKIAEKSPAASRLHGVAYTAGIVLSFLLLAGILLVFQAAGTGIGWGFHLQNPLIVALLAHLMFLIGLNLSGAYEISGGLLSSLGGKLAGGEGYSASFFAGVLATLVATPCTAPFMAAAIGYALVQPAAVALSIFAALGFGLALPFLLLSFVPQLQRILPRPGAWMEHFRQFLAFPMFAAAVWLVWVASEQAGSSAVLGVLSGMVAISFAIWLWRHGASGAVNMLRLGLIVILVLIAVALLPTRPAPMTATPENQAQSNMFGEVFSEQTLENMLKGNDPVFVEMTAAWCITCKLNHATSLNIDSTKALFAEKGVRYLIGDWTNQDPAITKFLKAYGRSGVPVYVYYAPPDASGQRPEPVLLPQILTPALVKEYLDQ